MQSTTLPHSSSSSPSLPQPPLSPISPTSSFTHHLPKIELHAHLTGSIRPETLHTIWSARRHHHHHKLDSSISPGLQDDPLTVLAPTARFDVKTFFPLFSKYIYRLVDTTDTVIVTTNAVLEDFCADGVVYLELRTTPRDIAAPEGEGGGGGGGGGKECYIRTVLDCITKFTSEQRRRLHVATGDDNKGRLMMMMMMMMTTYLILSIDRRNTAVEAMHVVDLAIKYRDRGVVGVDLCGDPCKGDVSVFRDAFAKAKAAGLGVTLHFAEVGKGVDGEAELRMLLGFRPDRVGHVCHPGDSIRQAVLDLGLGVELCVSCNVMAGLTEGGVGEHHFRWWWEKRARVALCTDDVGIFGSSLSNEYHIVAEAFGLGKQDLLRLARKPIECIFGPETERKRLYDIFDKFEVMQDGEG